MIIFVFDPTTAITTLLQRTSITILNYQKMGMVSYQEFASNTLQRAQGLILEITEPTPELHYLLAQAVILNKPTLCLYRKNKPPRDILNHLHKQNIPSRIMTKNYTVVTLEQVAQSFLHAIDTKIVLTETPTIKFTLRLTPTIEHYLEWLGTQQQANKAEYIRTLLKQSALNDSAYQKDLEC